MFISNSSENYDAGHALFLALFNLSVSSVTDAEFSPRIQRAEWVGWDLPDTPLRIPALSSFAGGKPSCGSCVGYYWDISWFSGKEFSAPENKWSHKCHLRANA